MDLGGRKIPEGAEEENNEIRIYSMSKQSIFNRREHKETELQVQELTEPAVWPTLVSVLPTWPGSRGHHTAAFGLQPGRADLIALEGRMPAP